MTATVSKAGPYYSSGEIKFSSLRSNFRAQERKETSGGSENFFTDTASIKASELFRSTSTVDTNPIVPDATENESISTFFNWKLSQFRGSIKYYYITQSGTDLNFDIDAQTWNNNLNKNIRKFLFVDGTCGSNDATIPSAALNVSTFNLTIDTYGSILGASGRGGGTGSGAPAISGQKGGDALEILSNGITSLNTTQTYKTVSGVDSNLLSLDIYYNSNVETSKPVVVYIHGGGWAVGDKDAVDSKATFFTSLGYVFVTINYRLSPAANMVLPYRFFVGDDGTTATASTRIKYPTHVQDCAAAVTWVYNNISPYGGDQNKLVLMGHSAGCQLVSLLSTNQSYLTAAGLPSGKILGCIANDSEGISGIFQQITNPVSDGDMDPNVIRTWYQNAFGIYPNKIYTDTLVNLTTDFATTAAAEASYATASPINYVSSSAPPFLVITRGPESRVAREVQFVTALQNAGGTVTHVSYPGDTYTHMEINESIGATNDPPEPVSRPLPSGVSNVSTQIQNWITNLVPAPVVSSPAGANNIVLVRTGSRIYAGGGGGEKGQTGADGSSGVCANTSTQQGCGGAPGCPSGYYETGSGSGGCCQTYSYCCGLFNCGCVGCSQYLKYRYCRQEYAISGGAGGEGGNGGPGRGYNNQSGSLSGAIGSPGGVGQDCYSGGSYAIPPTDGERGESGGNGGEWGIGGEGTNNTGAGGLFGRAIFGSTYSVTGTINSDTINGPL